MRSKGEILSDLHTHADQLDGQHYELAAVAMIETEIQIDIRDQLEVIAGFVEAITGYGYARLQKAKRTE